MLKKEKNAFVHVQEEESFDGRSELFTSDSMPEIFFAISQASFSAIWKLKIARAITTRQLLAVENSLQILTLQSNTVIATALV